MDHIFSSDRYSLSQDSLESLINDREDNSRHTKSLLAIKEYFSRACGVVRHIVTVDQLSFPSFHSNPESDFPARWTEVSTHLRSPRETVVAPRIRLAPGELQCHHRLIEGITEGATAEAEQPAPSHLNLSHQALGDPFQYPMLKAMLALNASVRVLNLSNNELETIVPLGAHLQHVEKLYVSHNLLKSFEAIPPLFHLILLVVSHNCIAGVEGLSATRFPRLQELSVVGNPIADQRVKLCNSLQQLRYIDHFPTWRYK